MTEKVAWKAFFDMMTRSAFSLPSNAVPQDTLQGLPPDFPRAV